MWFCTQGFWGWLFLGYGLLNLHWLILSYRYWGYYKIMDQILWRMFTFESWLWPQLGIGDTYHWISQPTWLLIKWYIQNMTKISHQFHQKKLASLSLVLVYHSGNNQTHYWNSHACTDICIRIDCCIQYTNSCVNRSCNSPVIKPRGIQYIFGYS